jgi:hypothetical protein
MICPVCLLLGSLIAHTYWKSVTIDRVRRTFLNGSSTRFLMYPKPPFDFERSAGIHGRFKKSLPDIYENDSYKRLLHVGEKPVFVAVSSKVTAERPKLLVEVHPRLRNAGIKSLRTMLHSMCAPSFDFSRFCKLVKKDRLMLRLRTRTNRYSSFAVDLPSFRVE